MQPPNTLGHTSAVKRCESSRLTEFLTYYFHLYKFCNVYSGKIRLVTAKMVGKSSFSLATVGLEGGGQAYSEIGYLLASVKHLTRTGGPRQVHSILLTSHEILLGGCVIAQ